MKARTDKIDLSFDNYVEEAFPLIKKDMCEFTFSNGAFSLIDVIDYLLEKTEISNVDISSWVASYGSFNHIIDFLEDQKLNKMRFLMDSGFARTRKELYNHIQKWYPDSIALTQTHAKFVLIYNDNFNFVIETSANLNKNNRLESFRITENKEYCDFFRNTFDDIYNKSRGNGGMIPINKIYG